MDVSPFKFDNSFAREMEGFYLPWSGASVPQPQVLRLNVPLAAALGLDAAFLASDKGAAILSGAEAPVDTTTLAMVYAGHQFGHFSAQLGDGRALLLGELVTPAGARVDLHLKGSGRTPFSRGGDGKAVLGPVLREYLISEAMHAFSIPTTRALAAVRTGESIWREGPQPGAVLARIAASHLRVGTFEFFAARGEQEKVRQLADYAITRHDPETGGDIRRFLEAVMDRQAKLVAQWMSVGFVHGVMNTDNMAISGETIDYGPCAFLDAYDPAAVFSSIDRGGRYAFANQPRIALWNLGRLAESLLPVIPGDSELALASINALLESFPARYHSAWLAAMRPKIGLAREAEGDADLLMGLMRLMTLHKPDFTAFFIALGQAAAGDGARLLAMLPGEETASWLARWYARLEVAQAGSERADVLMARSNPLYIPRNHVVQAALDAASAGDMTMFDRILAALQAPFTLHQGCEDLLAPPPPGTPPCRTFCGT